MSSISMRKQNFSQNIPNGLRVIDIFHEQAGDKIFTNCPVTKSMFDYRALYESQPSVSVDFLMVLFDSVQFHPNVIWKTTQIKLLCTIIIKSTNGIHR